MKKIFKQSVYVPVEAFEDSTFVVTNQGANSLIDKVERTDAYVFTEGELKKLLGDTFEAGANNKIKPFTTDLCGVDCPDKEEYLDGMFNKIK